MKSKRERSFGNRLKRVTSRALQCIIRIAVKEPRIIVKYDQSFASTFDVKRDPAIRIIGDFTRRSKPALDVLGKVLCEREMRECQAYHENGGVIWAIIADHDECVGFGAAKEGERLSRWWHPVAPNDWILSRVTVFAQWRGRGIAPNALSHLCKELTVLDHAVYADILRSNKSSRRAFMKVGFVEVGISRAFVPLSESTPTGLSLGSNSVDGDDTL